MGDRRQAHAWIRASHPDSNSQRWVNFICERLRSHGEPAENFVTALFGTIEMYELTPDLFFGLVNAITKVEWLPIELVAEIKESARRIMHVMGVEQTGSSGLPAQRWLELARAV